MRGKVGAGEEAGRNCATTASCLLVWEPYRRLGYLGAQEEGGEVPFSFLETALPRKTGWRSPLQLKAYICLSEDTVWYL